MTEIRLTYHLYHTWQSANKISVIGSAFLDDSLLKEKSLINYFEDCRNEKSFAEKLIKLSGHFAVVIESETEILAAVDEIRTFPVFFYQKENNIVIADNILSDTSQLLWHDIGIENFKKVYCTLENQTLLQHWQQLQAGEYVVVDKLSITNKIKTYYHHSLKSEHENESALQKKLPLLERKLIDKIIKYANNRTILIPLSGGYDSRYLLALLKENNYEKIKCFTYGKKNSYEVLIAKNVAEKLNIKWHFVEYTNELLDTFFAEEWQQYSNQNHQFSSLPHEQDFFTLYHLKQNNLLPDNAIIMNGFCQDLHAGSIIEPIKDFDIQKFIYHKYQLNPDLIAYENSWNGYQEWFIKNRVSKFIINSIRVYEYFGLDFYLPFWDKDWINFWYSLNIGMRLNQKLYKEYLFDGIFRKYKIDFKKPSHNTTNSFYTLKKLAKSILPEKITRQIQHQNSVNREYDVNNSLYLYERIYETLCEKPDIKDFKINNIHAIYLLEKLKSNQNHIK